MKNYFHPHYIDCAKRLIKRLLWSTINKINALYWNVQLGSGCTFYGFSSFNLIPNSKITVGKECSFYSSSRSNRIGIYSPCMLTTLVPGSKIIIGNNCGFSGTVISSALSITIGNNVRCGANTLITDTDFHTDDYRAGANRPVIIEDNVWLGYGVKVLKGVHIGYNTIIGAGSIVTKDIPANVMAAGNPCRVIKDI